MTERTASSSRLSRARARITRRCYVAAFAALLPACLPSHRCPAPDEHVVVRTQADAARLSRCGPNLDATVEIAPDEPVHMSGIDVLWGDLTVRGTGRGTVAGLTTLTYISGHVLVEATEAVDANFLASLLEIGGSLAVWTDGGWPGPEFLGQLNYVRERVQFEPWESPGAAASAWEAESVVTGGVYLAKLLDETVGPRFHLLPGGTVAVSDCPVLRSVEVVTDGGGTVGAVTVRNSPEFVGFGDGFSPARARRGVEVVDTPLLTAGWASDLAFIGGALTVVRAPGVRPGAFEVLTVVGEGIIWPDAPAAPERLSVVGRSMDPAVAADFPEAWETLLMLVSDRGNVDVGSAGIWT